MHLLAVTLSGCADPAGTPNAASFVLLELFTSQSCSSCPSADADLNAVAERQRAEGTREFAVAWHVDYWNGLGWVDPYSSEEASDRQFAYVAAIPVDRYTPMVVANGQEAFVGSDDGARIEAVDRWLAQPSPVEVAVRPDAIAGGELRVEVDVSGAPDGAELLVALLHSGITTFVPSGENAGRTLTHENVVRDTVHAPADAGEVVLRVPADVPEAGASVIAIVQDVASLAVHGAELAEVGAPAAALSGIVGDASGAPLPGAVLQACAEVCVAATADDEGAWRIDGLTAGDWSLHATGPSPDDADLVLPVAVAGETVLDVRIPRLGPPVAVPATPELLEVAPGLVVELDAARLPGIAEVRAATLEGSAWPPVEGRAVGVGFSLSPSGAGADLPFEVDGTGDLRCTAADGRTWIACEALPALGSVVLLR